MLKKPSLYFKSRDKGFTLIELLVVIAILGLIASIAVTALNAARLRSRDSRRLGDMENMRKIFGVLLSNNDSYIVTCTNNQISTCNFAEPQQRQILKIQLTAQRLVLVITQRNATMLFGIFRLVKVCII